MTRLPKKSPAAPVAELFERLRSMYPDAHCALHYRSPLELLVATILSAQCTDVRVNLVTPPLFERCPNAQALVEIPRAELEGLIQSTGFFRAKARAIQETARDLVEKYAGEVPKTMEELTSLRGVGRKTANVVLGNAFGLEVGVVVDTHIGRLARRLGLTSHKTPEKVELDLMAQLPQKDWTLWAHLLISHGRAICTARSPRCNQCPLSDLCPSAGKV